MAHTIVRSVSRIVYIQRTTTTATKVESYVSIFLFLDIDVRVWRVPQFVDFSSLTSYIFIFSLSISRRWICVPSSNDCVRSIHLLWATYSKNSTTPSYSFRKTEKKTHNNNKEREKKKKTRRRKRKRRSVLRIRKECWCVLTFISADEWVMRIRFDGFLRCWACVLRQHMDTLIELTHELYTHKKNIYKKLVARCSSRNRSILFVS